MKKLVFLTLLFFVFSCGNSSNNTLDFTTQFEKSGGTKTPTYQDLISYYEKLAAAYSQISLFSFGQTDQEHRYT